MANAVNQNFHSQLRSVVDILAITAVKEISKLVDDGFAILHLEIARSQEENEALKCKIQTMELQMTRGCEQELGLREQLDKCRCGGVQSGENSYKTTNGVFADRMDAQRPSRHENTPASPAHVRTECADMEEESTELVLVKEETVEEVRDPQEEMNPREERAVKWRASSREKRPVEETQNKAANHTEELTEQHRTRRAVWEVSGLESVLKAEPDYNGANKRDQHLGNENDTGGLYHQDSEYFMFGRAGHTGAIFISEVGETEPENSAGSYAPATDSENLSVELIDVTSALNGCTSSDAHFVTSQGLIDHCNDVARKKSYICRYCGKTFSRRNVMMKHHRVHTGEKPFSCLLCGRRFTDSSNLRKHQSVHTGEKRFRCAQCGKCFSDSSGRKRHQTVHTGKKPFECVECGKRFTRSWYLKRHCQQFHSWQMTFNEHAV